ncbi:uncharacterized protein LOC115065769 isoform X1 [Bactrocera dorsalis]|uniref:Uncharacterized protein LOC115065769 isoform X1 n=1 Tax=Bactrocera dorsalis TaxID=27457 RepID=A0ABM3JDM5_BACDO|nr:uncharacterized protein LOC115065769 isoform X1 [Bactrocera dorsalis]
MFFCRCSAGTYAYILQIFCAAFDSMVESESALLLKYKQKRKESFARKKKWLLTEILKKRTIVKSQNFFKTIPFYPPDIYLSHFRMSRETFAELKSALEPFWITSRGEYSMDQALHITLWKLSNSRVTYRELSDKFDVSKGTAHKIFLKTINAICQLKHEICWPSISQQQTIMERFQASRPNAFPFVVGCLDGTHFKINTPKKDAISYYDRKGNYSIIMQGICDSTFRFLDVFIGYPGSCHDANVWKNSPIYKGITCGEIQLAKDAIILADSAYPLSKYLIAPYRDNGHLLREEKQFNYYLSSTRVFIEQAFGILRGKFKILNHIDIQNMEEVSKVVLACVILHNLIMRNNFNDSEINYPLENFEIFNENDAEMHENINDTNEGIIKRNNLKMLFVS